MVDLSLYEVDGHDQIELQKGGCQSVSEKDGKSSNYHNDAI